MSKDIKYEKAIVLPELKSGYNFKNITEAVLQNQPDQPNQGQQDSESQDSGQGNSSQQPDSSSSDNSCGQK